MKKIDDLFNPLLNLKCGINGYASDFALDAQKGREPISHLFKVFGSKSEEVSRKIRALTKNYSAF